jgi:RimJ/RimL family protein N-acetyltransferase
MKASLTNDGAAVSVATMEVGSPVTDRARRFSVPSIEGRHVFLRAVGPEDYPFMRLIETSSELGPRWRLRGSTPSPEEWAQSAWNGVLAQFLVISRKRNDAIGVVSVYEPSFQDGYARIAAARFDSTQRSPLMMLGFGLFIDYVFKCWNFRKLYAEVPEYNYPQFASGHERFFVIEGRLREHFYLAGELWDRLVLAVYRDSWEERGGRLVRAERVDGLIGPEPST